MASCADCGRIVFGKVLRSEVWLGPICGWCCNAEIKRSRQESEVRYLERLYVVPSPVLQPTPAPRRPRTGGE